VTESRSSYRSSRPLNVLVVDDSAVVRQGMALVLARDKLLTVVTAANPLIAMQKMLKQRPDVIVLDIEMPGMDGLTFLRKIMSEDPLPVVICSAVAERGTDTALRALDHGAVEVVAKPRLGVREFLEDSAVLIIDAIHAAARARLRRRGPGAPLWDPGPVLAASDVLPSRPCATHNTADRVAALGASTGGTEALLYVLRSMPPDAPAMVIVQHMPEMYTRAFADRLNSLSRIEVKEAATGDRVVSGRALIAPGNRHMLLTRSGADYAVDIVDGPLVSRHRPSVDLLFRSVAQTAGPNAIGVIMTGMGADGAEGLLEMKQAGASTIAQDEPSCVVFGMPKEAIARGGVDDIAPLVRIPELILRRASATGR
jgi:two-component system, chemotaxis family, protein-glutamate methylesterase/glutaminase